VSKTHKEMIVTRPSPFNGGVRKLYYSENPQFPKYRLLLEQSRDDDANNLWNALLEFNLLVNFSDVNPKQRIIKIVITFHNWASSSFVSGGLEHLQEDGIAVHELLNGLKEIGAERQHNIVTSYTESSESDLDRQYYQCMSDTKRLIEEYVNQNIIEFVKWA
jgi:hypothetical protein